MSELTRKTALLEAVELVKNAELPQEHKNELIQKLMLCAEELPFAKWTEEAIYDACSQFLIDHGRVPSISEFDRAGLPSHTVVKRRLGITVRQLRLRCYPQELLEEINRETYIEAFREEYRRCGARTQKEYDRKRESGQPCTQTILKATGLKRWSELLDMAGLEPTRSKRISKRETTMEGYTVSATYPWDKLMEAIKQDREVTA